MPGQRRPDPDPEPGAPAMVPAANAVPDGPAEAADETPVSPDDPVAVPERVPNVDESAVAPERGPGAASVAPARPSPPRRIRHPAPGVPRAGISWARVRQPGHSGGVRPASGRPYRGGDRCPVSRARVRVPAVSCPAGQARLASTPPRHASDRITEVQIVQHTPDRPVIPGWRLLISSAGRFWAFRDRPFPRLAVRAGAESAVDADTFEEVQAVIAAQEEKARTVVEGVPS
ncbi:hypothetical protein ABT340_36390 [Streptosporangium sp. NPDC000239]|uniref:hypothetical protein n=1 Tax=Streptosporangium sp. NPDC000239 TaxID=3154248 RepID=UPI00331BC4B6